MQPGQLEEVARFLEEHPGFSPELMGEDAVVSGFHVGACFLTIGDLGRLIASRPLVDAREAALLLTSPPTISKGRLP
jgi:hypothetical protein